MMANDIPMPTAAAAAPRALLLVVDDQPANIQVLYALFRDEYDVRMATSGAAALQFCQNQRPDLILLDVVMPEMGGYEVCHRLKADPTMRDIPVIFVTGQDSPLDEARGLDEGGVDFIVKPFHEKVVRARVRTHLTLKSQADRLRQKQNELHQRQAELEAVNDASPLGLFHIGLDGGCTYANHAFEVMFGLFDGSALGMGWRTALDPREPRQATANWFRHATKEHCYTGLHELHHVSRQILQIQIRVAPVVVDGVVASYVGTADDVSARLAAEAALSANEARLRLVTDNVPAAITYLDHRLRFTFANASMHALLGTTDVEVLGRDIRDVIGMTLYEERREYLQRALAGERVEFVTTSVLHGQTVSLQSTYVPDVLHGYVCGIYTISNDITALKQNEADLRRLARQDPLTGLPNRTQLYETLELARARNRRLDRAIGVLFLDIDHFKQVNDTLGHANGDLVLQEFSRRLRHAVRVTDTVARLSGDEFVVVLESLSDLTDAVLVAEKVLQEVRQPWQIDGQTIAISTSIGLVVDRTCRHPGATLIALADESLYAAKEAGRNTFRARLVPE